MSRCAGASGLLLLTLLLVAACRLPGTAPSTEPLAERPPPFDPSRGEATRLSEVPFGVQVFEADVDTPAVEQLRAAGVAWARTRVLWKAIEPERREPHRYDWAMSDHLIGATTAAGFRNVVVVYANPSWAAERECGPVRSERLGDYAAFWTALVERYDGDGEADSPLGGVARLWQVGNEVDYDPTVATDEPDYGGCFGDNPAAYAEQLVIAARAAKRADPKAWVGFGPVAYDRFTTDSAPPGWSAPSGPFVYDFTAQALEQLYRRYPNDPELPFFDFVAVHNYNDNADQWDRPPLREMVAKLATFRNEQLAVPGLYDLRALPLLVSETGLAAAPSDAWTERSEELQAAYVGQTFVRSMAAGVFAAIWYTARDNILGDCVPPHWDWLAFGLMRSSDFKSALEERCPKRDFLVDYQVATAADPRLAMRALRTLTTLLRGAVFEGQLSEQETGSSAVEAYRFRLADGRVLLAAWATNGRRLGCRGVPSPRAQLAVDERLLQPWRGQVVATGLLGEEEQLGALGQARVSVELTERPVYITLVPKR